MHGVEECVTVYHIHICWASDPIKDFTSRYYVWHPGSHCGNTKNQLKSNVPGCRAGGQHPPSGWRQTPTNLALTFIDDSGLGRIAFVRNKAVVEPVERDGI